jgi:hypothetical protein
MESTTTTKELKTKKVKGVPEFVNKYPEHKAAIWLLLKNNAGIRRLASLNIINYLKQTGKLDTDLKVHVEFISARIGSFEITYKQGNTITKSVYDYSEKFFIDCFLASFVNFSNEAQIITNDYVNKEMNKSLLDVTNNDDIENIVHANVEKENDSEE